MINTIQNQHTSHIEENFLHLWNHMPHVFKPNFLYTDLDKNIYLETTWELSDKSTLLTFFLYVSNI